MSLFKKGYDARRYVPVNSGLIEYYSKLGDLHRLQSLDAANFVFDTMNNEKASLKLRVVCAQEIMNRAAGKPVDRSVIVTLDSASDEDPSKIDTSQLERIIAKLDNKPVTIDSSCKEVN